MSDTPSAKSVDDLLDNHAEYYIRQTMKFFQNEGESPALSKNNDGDLAAKAQLRQLFEQGYEEIIGADEPMPTATTNIEVSNNLMLMERNRLRSKQRQRKAAVIERIFNERD